VEGVASEGDFQSMVSGWPRIPQRLPRLSSAWISSGQPVTRGVIHKSRLSPAGSSTHVKDMLSGKNVLCIRFSSKSYPKRKRSPTSVHFAVLRRPRRTRILVRGFETAFRGCPRLRTSPGTRFQGECSIDQFVKHRRQILAGEGRVARSGAGHLKGLQTRCVPERT